MDLCLARTIGKSMQTAILVNSIVILFAWFVGVEEMNLVFNNFQVTAVFIAVLLMGYAVQDGKSNWSVHSFSYCRCFTNKFDRIEGIGLMTVFLIAALASWFTK